MVPEVVENLGQVVVRVHLGDHRHPMAEVLHPDVRQRLHRLHKKALDVVPLESGSR